jgi:hypothetical protein
MVVLRLLGGASLEGVGGAATGPAFQRHRVALLAVLAAPRPCASFWGRNLGDKRYFTRAINHGTFIISAPGDPRTWGTTLRYPCARG